VVAYRALADRLVPMRNVISWRRCTTSCRWKSSSTTIHPPHGRSMSAPALRRIVSCSRASFRRRWQIDATPISFPRRPWRVLVYRPARSEERPELIQFHRRSSNVRPKFENPKSTMAVRVEDETFW